MRGKSSTGEAVEVQRTHLSLDLTRVNAISLSKHVAKTDTQTRACQRVNAIRMT